MLGDEGEDDETLSRNSAKAQFNAESTKRLIELYEPRRNLLKGKSAKPEANKKRTEAWKYITNVLSVEFGVQFTMEQVKKRWQNIRSEAKQQNQDAKKVRKVTGGGKVEETDFTISDQTQAILSLEQDTQAFSGFEDSVETVVFSEEVIVESEDVVESEKDRSFEEEPIAKFPKRSRPPTTPVAASSSSSSEIKDLQKQVLQQQLRVYEKFEQVLDRALVVMDTVESSPIWRHGSGNEDYPFERQSSGFMG